MCRAISPLIGPALVLGLLALPGCRGNPAPKVDHWEVLKGSWSKGLTRRAGEPGSHVIGLTDEEWKQGKRLLEVSCHMPPGSIWQKAEDGAYQFQLSKFRLLVPGGDSVAPFAIAWGMSGWKGVSDMPVQKSTTGKEPLFTIWFAVGPEVSKRTDLRFQYGDMPAQPLTEDKPDSDYRPI
jgi:hypothetical protein